MTGSGKVGKSYGTDYGLETTYRVKSIRLTEDQDSNWDPELIRSVLEGSHTSNDSIRINALKNYLKELYDLMGNKMEFTGTPTDQDIELITKIKEVM